MENLEQYYSIPEEWENYGDVNPEMHGGLFVKWERDMWHIIETTNKEDMGVPENGHMFQHMYMEPMDIWVNGNPYEGFTERTVKELDTFSGVPFGIINPEDNELPEGETYEDYVNHYLEHEFSNLIGYLVHAFRGYLDSYPTEREEKYWGYLEGYGINQEDF